jgi:hypothetical protein
VLQKPFTRETICNSLERALSHALRKPVSVQQPSEKDPNPKPRLGIRLRALHVILIVVGLLLVALCIFLMFR